MSYPIDRKLVVSVSSNALFNLEKEDEIFREKGLNAYRTFQIENRDKPLDIGLAFPFVKRFLNINNIFPKIRPVEVVLMSKNSPETGIRIFNSIKSHDLDISRCAFTSGDLPYKYIPVFNISLHLSTDEEDVQNAIKQGYAAGKFILTKIEETEDESQLRVAFDFDGVLADDESERVYKEKGLEEYYKYEIKHVKKPHNPGPLATFFRKLSTFQQLETKRKEKDLSYKKVIRTAIITARNAPAHERAIATLKNWGVTVDDMFLLGGVDKGRVLKILKPHLFMDDQLTQLDPELVNIPLVHVPFGKLNE